MGGYTKVPNELPRLYGLSGNVFKTLVVLMGFCYGERCECWPSHSVLMKATGYSRATVIRHLGILRNQGFIRWEVGKKGRANRYTVVLKARDPDLMKSFHKVLPTLHPLLRKKTKNWQWQRCRILEDT